MILIIYNNMIKKHTSEFLPKEIMIRKDITRQPTDKEISAIQQYGQDIKNKCIDCGTPTYYFNQCENCNDKMIAHAKIMY